MPVWLLVLLLSVATYRLTRLVVKDDFPPVLWLRDRMVSGWRPLTEKEWEIYRAAPRDGLGVKALDLPAGTPAWVRQVRDIDHGNEPEASRYVTRARWVPQWLSDLLSCPWCASGWVALVLVTATALTVGVPAPVLVWPAVWGAGSLLAARNWS
jgi:hypothetical protein